MLQDSEPGKPETYLGEAKEETHKVEEKKQPAANIKPPEEFIYDPVSQEDQPH